MAETPDKKNLLPKIQSASIGERILDAFTKSNGLVSLVVVLLGFLVATILVLAVGRNPGGMYSAIIQVVSGWDLRRGTHNVRYIGEWLVASMPLILCGLSMGFAARTGLFNIGAEGQYAAGITAAQFTALYFPPIPGLHWIMAVLAALIAGAVWGGIVGFSDNVAGSKTCSVQKGTITKISIGSNITGKNINGTRIDEVMHRLVISESVSVTGAKQNGDTGYLQI